MPARKAKSAVRKASRQEASVVQASREILPDPSNSPFSTIEDAIADLRKGRMIVLVDDEDRENEGDLVLPAEKVTSEAMAFMVKKASGLPCLALTEAHCDRLQLPLQTSENTSRFGTAFTVTIEASKGVTTGISAADRAHTIRVAGNPKCRPEELARPGHVFPLRARDGGVLVRAGQTEGSVDLCKLAGLWPAAVICEILNDDGTCARLSQLELFAAEYRLKIVSIADLIEYRRAHERLIKHVTAVEMPTRYGHFKAHVYQSTLNPSEHHIALVCGNIAPGSEQKQAVPVRVHSECLTGDAFGSLRCDCGDQLQAAMKVISEHGKGVLLYMRQEGRGIGLVNKLLAYELQDHGADTVEANKKLGFKPDLRKYGMGAQILEDLGVRKMKLITNNPRKIVGIGSFNLEIVERIPLAINPNPQNVKYLRTKKQKLKHFLEDI